MTSLPAGGRFCLDGLRDHPEGRWTFAGCEPHEIVRVEYGSPSPLSALERISTPDETAIEGDALELAPADVPHWVGFVGYDAGWSDPPRTGLREAPRLERDGWPVLWLARYESMIALESASGAAWALAADEFACDALIARSRIVTEAPRAHVGPVRIEERAVHRARIEHALDAIAAGDIYQVNLARPWSAAYEGSALPLFSAMRAASPVPLGMYLELPDRALVARTMERFLRWDRVARRLRTSPIKGTIARGGDDEEESRRLRSDDKERAEHSMIVDLMRNDLSRVAAVGSVKVRDPLHVEPFAGLSHLVTTVECETRAGVSARDVLEATFPPGSITGAPKLAAMELIEREEDTARGVYTGALGYVDRAGGLSLAVAIRTATIAGGEVTFLAGGGLVSASDADREIAETELKAQVFLDAIAHIRSENLD